jgi:hypothetical protein
MTHFVYIYFTHSSCFSLSMQQYVRGRERKVERSEKYVTENHALFNTQPILYICYGLLNSKKTRTRENITHKHFLHRKVCLMVWVLNHVNAIYDYCAIIEDSRWFQRMFGFRFFFLRWRNEMQTSVFIEKKKQFKMSMLKYRCH